LVDSFFRCIKRKLNPTLADSYPVTIYVFLGREDWIPGWTKARSPRAPLAPDRSLFETIVIATGYKSAADSIFYENGQRLWTTVESARVFSFSRITPPRSLLLLRRFLRNAPSRFRNSLQEGSRRTSICSQFRGEH